MSEPKWLRHRFHANLDDWRPITFPPPGPCWRTGEGDGYSVVIAYLPPIVPVTDYWPEASEIESSPCDEIVFTERFPRPEWWAQDYQA